MKPQISVLVTDLDNTLWDWLRPWHASFTALVDVLVEEGGLDRPRLLAEAREIHQRYGTSEYSRLIEELPSMVALAKDRDTTELRDTAITAFREAREAAFELYPDVLETLHAIRREGTLIVAYTDSMSWYTSQRIRISELDGRISYLYSSHDHEFPNGVDPRSMRAHPSDYYKLKKTIHEHVPRGVTKPDVGVLRKILSDVGAAAEETAYVGDSLMRDTMMAQQAGVADVHAAYGDAPARPEYELLREVSHWPSEDVLREKDLVEEGRVTPTYSIECFGALLHLFEFVRHGEGAAGE